METLEQGRVDGPESPLAPPIEDARQSLAELNERFLAFARERPGTCIVAALALGFVLGKIAART